MHQLGVIFIWTLTGMFMLGLVGSAIVVLISFVEDFHELYHRDD
jgi:hypothetical protein